MLRAERENEEPVVAAQVALRRLLAVTGAAFEERAQLARALESRIAIEQAKGMLAERLAITLDEAFELLRGTARRNRRRLHDVAREVIEERRTPPSLVDTLNGRAAGANAARARRRA
jgi:AmiR/NasT family two-component response regulator